MRVNRDAKGAGGGKSNRYGGKEGNCGDVAMG